ncbi:hypothetical protein HG531_005983 [Fusarium graminearum]|nr:hypothetical protein HG531_005983 [Fusarium graminearum]
MRRSLERRRPLLRNTGLLETLDDVTEFLLGIGVDFTLARCDRFTKGERGAYNRGGLIVGSTGSRLSTAGCLCLVLLAQNVVLKRILAVIRLLTDIACTFEVGLIGFCTGDSSRLENLFREDVGGDGGCMGAKPPQLPAHSPWSWMGTMATTRFAIDEILSLTTVIHCTSSFTKYQSARRGATRSANVMTPDAYRPRDPSIEFAADIDLLAGLWQEAPFARLPSDAPPEVKAAVQNVENPARVYAIHQASRRHGFQLLVERYIHQLRSGCDNANCATPTCFTCRRRLAGKAPVRRYNTTSARTLAIYLASQDDPEKDLCPFFRRTPEASAALNNLIFSTRSPTQSHPDNKRTNVITSPSAHKNRVIRPRTSSSSSQDSISATRQAPHLTSSSASPVRVIEGPVNKDHRSFAANLFGTVTFKMIEWLTPSSMAAMSGKLGNFEVSDLKSSATDLDTLQESSSLTSTSTDLETQKTLPHEPNTPKPTNMVNQPQDTDWDESPFPILSPKSRHDSTHKSQNNAPAKPRAHSIDTRDFEKGEDDTEGVKLPQVNSHLRDKSLRVKSNKHAAVPIMSEIPTKPGLFENATNPLPGPVLPSLPLASEDNVIQTKLHNDQSNNCANGGIVSEKSKHHGFEFEFEAATPHSCDNILPQALSKLDVDLINFICDVYEEDDISESRHVSTHKTSYPYPQPVDERKSLRRHSVLHTARSREQSTSRGVVVYTGE